MPSCAGTGIVTPRSRAGARFPSPPSRYVCPVVVSGAPASGKSTLAPCSARSLALSLLSRDAIRDAIADLFGIRSAEERRSILDATFRVFYRPMEEILRVVRCLVAESNFHRNVAEQYLRSLLAKARTVIVHRQTPREVSSCRFATRSERGGRHWSSSDGERVAQRDAGRVPEAWAWAEPLDLGVPNLVVDTKDGYAPSLESVLDFIRLASIAG